LLPKEKAWPQGSGQASLEEFQRQSTYWTTTDWLGTALEESIGTSLARNDAIRIVSGDRSSQAAQDLKLATSRIIEPDPVEDLGRRLDCDFASLKAREPNTTKI
jgi:hypothetical protein